LLSLRRLGNELVLLSQMHKQRRTKTVDLAQVLFDVSAVIGDGGIALPSGTSSRRQDSSPGRQLARAPRQFGHSVQSVSNISDTSVTIIGLIKAKAVLPVILRRDAQVYARLLMPE